MADYIWLKYFVI